ncbi:cyclic AMP-dependent transcription factor ATF-7b isoform X2 [Gymnodraco acuticeps]|uniref:Cyclic AMP-dependent transcription factor ATF-7b isoform X2 n=1 Tax=Gymnodraco acuticeps TaxID=8218 RepID=A0A6P8UQ38_GYMAC|nr:cyclic AMP-dependent transcription factor ATF-7b isoform X2 [Gymnodraco acuticeps]XP_034079584.1 cyclic AMP-dependent transcription factor ATF-7b isoform X2 [Gymnodraco acuticeps]
MGDDRPFVCTAPGCGQRFTNEDHLSVHKHKHEMTLKFGPARTDTVIIADQTPTPTRFLKNCEEVGLFNELATSFEHEFSKAHEDDQRNRRAAPLQTPSEVKVEDDVPLQVDSSSPGSPDSSSSMSDNSRDSSMRGGKEILTKLVASSTPTPTIVRPGSLPLHLSNDALNPTMPSPTSVITQTPPSNRQLGSPTSAFPLVRHLSNGQTIPLLPSPSQMTSVISLARPLNSVPYIPGIPGPPVGGASSGSSSPSGYSLHSEAKMRLKAALTHQGPGAQDGAGGGAGSNPAVPQRQEQSQQPSQNSDAPSPAQPQVVEGGFGDRFDVRLEREGGVQDDSQVADFSGRGDRAAVNGEKQVSNLLELRLGSHNHELCFMAVDFEQVSPAQPTGGRRRRASEMDPDERRERFLERNRAAASRCRQKRKVWVNSLEKKADDLVNMNVSLSNEVGLLRNEVAQLKQLLLAHKDCPVTVMQKKAAFLAAGGEETSRDTSSEPIGSPAAVIQHGPSPTASASSPVATINGLSVRAAEAVAMSVLAGMGSGQPGGVVMATQSQSTQR